jgi:2-iminobutanoate/2-iminopropanoate deaminase
MKKAILTQEAPAPIGPYSQAIEAGGFVFCSGQIPLDPKTGEILTGPIKDQTHLVMKNIAGVLKAANLNFQNVVKTTIFLVNMKDFAEVNEAYSQYFQEMPPARSTVAVKELPKGVQVEIEVIAIKP